MYPRNTVCFRYIMYIPCLEVITKMMMMMMMMIIIIIIIIIISTKHISRAT